MWNHLPRYTQQPNKPLFPPKTLNQNCSFSIQSCDKLFNGWTEHAYNEAIELSRSLQNIQRKNQILRNRRETLLESYDKLTKDILLSERQWDFLLRIQVLSREFHAL